jgi:hypothetical protein
MSDPRVEPTEPAGRPSAPPAAHLPWLGFLVFAIGAAVLTAALIVALHVHRHSRAIEATVQDIRLLAEREQAPRLPIEYAMTEAARGRPPFGGAGADRGVLAGDSPAAAAPMAPSLYALAEAAWQRRDVAQARRLFCAFLASAADSRGANAEWVARARLRLIACDAWWIERRLVEAERREP